MVLTLVFTLMAASPLPQPGGYARPKPWLDPRFAHDVVRKEAFEFDPMFDHQRVRPPYALRIFVSHPELASHPERLPPKLLLGDLLFHAPSLLGGPAKFFGLSCDSCHPNGSATPDIWVGPQSSRPGTIDMLSDYFTPMSDDGIADARRVPSLRGARYTSPYGHAGSVASLGDFVDHVVSAELEQPPMRRDWRDALVLYLEQFDFLPNAELDALGRLTAKASLKAHLGEKLFTQPRSQFDGMSCASCHVPESFFTDRRTHALNHGHDPAPGEGFDTPSLLNLDETAPYFFDASAPTLTAAVAQIDRKHGLGLSAEERVQLVAYLDAVGAVPDKPHAPVAADEVTHALAYLSLLTAGPVSDDRELWPLCLDTVSHQLRGVLRTASSGVVAAVRGPIASFAQSVRVPAHRVPSAANRASLDRLRRDIETAMHRVARATAGPRRSPRQ